MKSSAERPEADVKDPGRASLWGLILAGGDGMRLRPLTRRITGDERPKQFCPLLHGETLLDRTRRRMELLVRPDRHVVVVSQPHAQYYHDLAGELAPGRLAIQPSNRGTAAGMLRGLVRIASLAGSVPLAVFPCDHYISDDRVFARRVADAFSLAQARPDLVVVLGIAPTHAETQYGWIEPGRERLCVSDGAVGFGVRRFWEKPARAQAQTLLRSGALWNSFVMVGWVDAFLALVAEALPGLVAAFTPVWRADASGDETPMLQQIYHRIPAEGFSDAVLARLPERLAVVRANGFTWTDLGDPERTLACLDLPLGAA